MSAFPRLFGRRKITCWCIFILMTFVYLSFHDAPTAFNSVTNDFRADDYKSIGPLVRQGNLNVRRPAKILLWSSMFGREWGFSKNYTTTQNNKCIVISNRSHLPSADAVVFHLFDITATVISRGKLPDSLPTYHRKDQIWVLYNLEPNIHIFGNLRNLNGHFNATWSYIPKSDIYAPYGHFRERTKPVQEVDYFEVNSKSGAAAMISNCLSESERLEIVTQLRDFIPIRFLGACGDGCPGDYKSCVQEVRNYKFYFSLENSHCRDYVTEKYWRAIENGQVPIVAWRYSMRGQVIPNSYINIYDFSSLKEAGQYIQRVNADKTLYNRYFQWKHKFEPHYLDAWAQLCDHTHSKDRPYTTYHDMEGWLTGNSCKQLTVRIVHYLTAFALTNAYI